ncbi:hypothetical protein CALCODRAFT_183186 [Calocera cornea HHB12733]|uniref:Vacuolar membrane-associated protein IML1 n=1 Tax=Calocera cornea HHB12733 TaxID=1353952 RepID=A0A165CBF3_9BASI|nr:hypothetical protein CALCODRAFT_183186 [Calocera cornea HHB12733]
MAMLPPNRRRSNTVTSVQSSSSFSSLPVTPLSIGDTVTLLAWVQDNFPGNIKARINLDAWPGCASGDLLAVTIEGQEGLEDAFLFVASEQDGTAMRSNAVGSMQISLSADIGTSFGFKNRTNVQVTKVDKDAHTAEHIELCFRDQYLGRSEMWRLGMSLEETCVHDDQKVMFAACIEAQIKGIFVHGQKVPSAYVTALTKTIYRSLSARHTLLIQISKELWEFAEDGERYYEKLCNSFLPELFSRWRSVNAHHLLSVVLISRVWYDTDAELKFATGPIRRSKTTKKSYKDLYKVIIDLEIMEEWETALVSLKQSLWDFQREILLQHVSAEGSDTLEACLIGRISNAHEGNILEAINLALNPFEKYHVDRDMGRTGLSISVVTPGTGRFEVDKELLRLTNERMNFNGFTVDLVCLTHRPLHAVPLFSYMSQVPEQEHSMSQREMNPLYYDSSAEHSTSMIHTKEVLQYHMIPSWVYCSYWERSWDMPFRTDRFIPRCRMYEIQMLGLLEQDISSTITIPFLDEDATTMFGPKVSSDGKDRKIAKERARREFSRNVFGRKPLEIPGPPFSAGYNSGSTLSIASRSSARPRELTGGALAIRTTTFRPGQLEDSRRSSLSQRMDGFPAIPPQEVAHARRNSVQMPPGIIKMPPVLQLEDPPRGRPTRVTPLSPPNEPAIPELSAPSGRPSTSPSKQSITSTKSATSTGGSDKSSAVPAKAPRIFSASWLLSSLRVQPALPQTSLTTVNRISPSTPTKPLEQGPLPAAKPSEPHPPVPLPIRKDLVSKEARSSPATVSTPVPISIKARQQSISRPTRPGSELYADAPLIHPSRASLPRNSLHVEGPLSHKAGGSAEASGSTPQARYRQIPSGLTVLNPSNPKPEQLAESAQEARRWKYSFAQPTFEHQMKWRSLCSPACLPLTIDVYPRQDELDNDFRTYHHTILVPDANSEFIRPPKYKKEGYTPETYQAEQLLRAIASFRLAQGFQFVVAPHRTGKKQTPVMMPSRLSGSFGRTGMLEPSSHVNDISLELKPGGASEVLRNVGDAPIYLSMGNQLHRISYDKELQEIKVTAYVRGRQREEVLPYECLIWPKHGDGYMRAEALFKYPAEHIGWNRMDMLLAGAPSPPADRMRYWRTRFVVIPSEDEPLPHYEPGALPGPPLSNEEIRIQGMEHLAELFGRLRWRPDDVRSDPGNSVPLLITYLDPLACLLDEPLMESLAEAHMPRASDRKRKAEKALEGSSLQSVARAMRDVDGGLVIEDHKWHNNVHKDSFSGSDFVTFLLREYRDVSTREEATEWGNKLMEQGLIEHCRSYHTFLDGHYYYRLTGEYAASSQTKRQRNWFNRHAPSRDTRKGNSPAKRQELVLTESITLDLDPLKHSDQAELVMLHHDIIHNPVNAFHFEMNWIGTTARYIDDVVWSWGRDIEEFGLKLVEAYVDQISAISTHSPFQSCISIPLAIPPPIVPDLAKRLPMGANPGLYFEGALLRELGYILDIESVNRYPEQVIVKYSYRHSPYTYPQYIHRSGLAFVQVVGGTDGFQWLANGLAIAGAVTRRLKQKQWDGPYAYRDESPQPAKIAESIRLRLQEFCADESRLHAFWEKVVDELPPVVQEFEELLTAV